MGRSILTYITDDELRRLNGAGLDDGEIARLKGVTTQTVGHHRRMLGLAPVRRASHKMSKYTARDSFDVPFEALSPRAQRLVVKTEARIWSESRRTS